MDKETTVAINLSFLLVVVKTAMLQTRSHLRMTKGVNHVAERGYHMFFSKQYTRNDTLKYQNETLPLFPGARNFIRIA